MVIDDLHKLIVSEHGKAHFVHVNASNREQQQRGYLSVHEMRTFQVLRYFQGKNGVWIVEY